MGFLRSLLLSIFILLFGLLVFSEAVDIAQRGASLLLESRKHWFPLLRLLYFYNGLEELEKAVNLAPTDLNVRLIRASALFEFRDIDYIRQICKEDLEFLVIYNGKKSRSVLKKFDNIIYYMLCALSIEDGELDKARFYFEELSKLKDASGYVKLLKISYPQLILGTKPDEREK